VLPGIAGLSTRHRLDTTLALAYAPSRAGSDTFTRIWQHWDIEWQMNIWLLLKSDYD